jgi:ABC-type polysaccharide/polyol phosphate export permease
MKPLSILSKYKDYVAYSSRISLSSRYSKMYLGIVWWFLDPLLLMAVYAFVYLFIFNRTTPHYFVFLLTGLIVWRWLSGSIASNSTSISSKIGILEQTPAPKQIFPLITLVVETVLFLAAFLLIVIAVIIDHVPITWHIIELVPLIAITFVFLFGVGIIVAHAGAYVADLRPALTYFLRLFFYISPIFYSLTILPQSVQELYYLNPVTTIVQSFRAVIINGTSPDYLGMSVILLIGLVLLAVGWILMDRHDKDYGRLK